MKKFRFFCSYFFCVSKITSATKNDASKLIDRVLNSWILKVIVFLFDVISFVLNVLSYRH